MLEDTPLVTVCIATRDRAELLGTAIDTVLRQSYRSLELVVVDDGSCDETQRVIQIAAGMDDRVRKIRHGSSKGLAAARNVAIRTGHGKYFTFIDDDDTWGPEFVATCVGVAEKSGAEWCFCTGFETKSVLGMSEQYVPLFHGPLLSYLLEGYTPPVASQFYSRSTLLDAGGYNEHIRSGVDHDLWLRLGARGAMLHGIPVVLAYPDTNLSPGARMTTNFAARRERIAVSLRTWRPLLEDNYPKGFYRHFVLSYRYAIARKQIASLVASLRLASALRLLVRTPFRARLLGFIARRTASAVLHRRSHFSRSPKPVSPSFPPFRAPWFS